MQGNAEYIPILQSRLDGDVAILEVGTFGVPGTVKRIVKNSNIQSGLITNITPDHLNDLGSFMDYAHVKGEFIEIMSGKSTIKVLKKVNKTTLDEEIAKYVAYHRYYQRLIAIRIISEGHSIAEAARIIGKSYQTVHRWAKTCESEGLEGLKPSFGGGRPSKLTYDQLIELDKIIEETPNMSMKDVHLIVNKKFDVDYSLKQIGKIVKKLGYNYSKAYPKFSKSPEDAEEQLKKT